VKERAGEPAQLQAGQFSRREPGELAELAVTGCRGPCDDPGFIDGGDVGGAIAVGVADLVIGPAEHVHQADQPDVGADLFAGLPDRRRGGRLARVHGTAEDTPPVVMADVADQQHAPCPVDGQDRHRRQEQQLVSDNGSQPGYMRSDTHLGNPTVRAADLDESAQARSFALIMLSPASSQWVEVRLPGGQAAGPDRARRPEPRRRRRKLQTGSHRFLHGTESADPAEGLLERHAGMVLVADARHRKMAANVT
jgi:hypothetical protein